MRQSRQAILRDFWPKSWEDVQAVLKAEHPLNVAYRQIGTYWEMVYSFVRHGIVHPGFWLENNAEGLFLFVKVEPFLAKLREAGQPSAFRNAEWVAKECPDGPPDPRAHQGARGAARGAAGLRRASCRDPGSPRSSSTSTASSSTPRRRSSRPGVRPTRGAAARSASTSGSTRSAHMAGSTRSRTSRALLGGLARPRGRSSDEVKQATARGCDGLPLLPGVEALLRDAQTLGLRRAVASSSSRAWVDGWLRRHDIRDRIETLVWARDDVRQVKPDPELFLLAASRLGVEPGACVVFEDSPNGMRAALAAGMRCVAVPNALTRPLARPAVDLVLESLAERPLARILESLALAPDRGRGHVAGTLPPRMGRPELRNGRQRLLNRRGESPTGACARLPPAARGAARARAVASACPGWMS